MEMRNKVAVVAVLASVCAGGAFAMNKGHKYNGPFEGKNLDKIAFPIGGIGSGMFCLEGSGAISHMSVRNTMEFFHEPMVFPAIYINDGKESTAKVLEGPVPNWKIFGHGQTSKGSMGRTYGLPRFDNASFKDRFPFGTVSLSDQEVPLDVAITGWNPFTPGNPDDASLPVGALEYKFTNTSAKKLDFIFSYNSLNHLIFSSTDLGSFQRDTGRIHSTGNGFILTDGLTDDDPANDRGFAVYTDDNSTVVDHGWFRGGWWDSFTVTWNNIANGRMVDNAPQDVPSPGASLFVPFELAPGESKTIKVMFAWHVPNSGLKIGGAVEEVPAFGTAPSKGAAPSQQAVTGIEGDGLVNTFDPGGDHQTGTLTSPEFRITKKQITFKVAGGHVPGKVGLNLLVDGEVVRTKSGNHSEILTDTEWNVEELIGKKATIEIFDHSSGAWGHILVDHIVMTDDPESSEGELLADFEGEGYGDWVVEQPEGNSCGVVAATTAGCASGSCGPQAYQPWYVSKFDNVKEVVRYWKRNYDRLRADSETFTKAFYDTTLPPEVVEAIAANLTILKSPTVLRLTDGRFWGWEGCDDGTGSCHGSCTHVWNYAQALPHLFPSLERSLRQTEFNESQNAEGHQSFRSNIPITEANHDFYAAADGQLGGIIKVYREWRISGDTEWMEEFWPKVRTSLDYCIKTWDPRHIGALEEPHHNTYDIEYWGPNGHCTSFYNGALNAAVKMGKALGDDVSEYEALLGKSIAYLEDTLYNGEYFYQQVMTEGIDAHFEPLDVDFNGDGYKAIAEEVNTQGPKYQYGTGCLSDGVLGLWIARACGLDELIDSEKIASHLKAVHKYNFKKDLSDHANTQRPSYALGHEAGLLICSWPNGGKPILPFVYSDEVWTGIEYQVASHLMMHGEVEKGLEIVRACRDRYDGFTRNPFNEYECGHWYARAMSSYGLIQGLTGLRYDAVDKSLFIALHRKWLRRCRPQERQAFRGCTQR